MGREARENHQERHGDDAATDAEQRAEQAGDEADGDYLEQARAESPRRRRCICTRWNRPAVVFRRAHTCT
jgi:hypothetical protein